MELTICLFQLSGGKTVSSSATAVCTYSHSKQLVCARQRCAGANSLEPIVTFCKCCKSAQTRVLINCLVACAYYIFISTPLEQGTIYISKLAYLKLSPSQWKWPKGKGPSCPFPLRNLQNGI